MVVVALVGISAAIVVPNLNGTIGKTRENGAAASLAATLSRARVVAMKQHSYVEVDTTNSNAIVLYSCPARYGSGGCISSYGGITDQVQQGVLVFGRDETRGVSITTPGTTLVFTPQGFPQTAAVYTYTLQHSGSTTQRSVTVTAAGEIQTL